MTKIELIKRLEAFPDQMEIACKMIKQGSLSGGDQEMKLTTYLYDIQRVEYNYEDGLSIMLRHG